MISVCTLSYFLVSAPSGMFFLNALHWAHFKLRNSVSDRATFEMGNKSLETRATTWQIQNDVWIIEKLETISASDWIPFTSSGQLWYVSKVWRILINRVTYYLQPLYSITHTHLYIYIDANTSLKTGWCSSTPLRRGDSSFPWKNAIS